MFSAIGIIAFSLFYFRPKEQSKLLPEPVKMTILSGQVRFPDKKPAPLALVELTYHNAIFKAAADKEGQFKIELPDKSIGDTMNLKIIYKGDTVVSVKISAIEANIKSPTIPFE